MTTKKEMDLFAERSIPILKENGYLKENLWQSRIKIIVTLLVGILIGGILLYGILTDGFKSEINLDVQPNVTVHNDPTYAPFNSNEYNFTMYPNFTIINEINCPYNSS